MNSQAVSKTNGSRRAKDRPPFNTVLVYENLASGERAWKFYEKLTRKFEGDFDFSHLMWSFSVLGDPKTRILAVQSAADAHLVILSFNGDAALPANVRDWMQRWVKVADNRNSALATLVDHKAKPAAAASAHAYLRQILDASQIDFFPHCTGSAFRMNRPE